MSIYGTSWSLQFPRDGEYATYEDDWVEVFCQVVPGHIDYTGPDWEWLPPPSGDANVPRAVAIVSEYTEKGTERCGQEYVEPLLLLTWQEYQEARWSYLHQRICEELVKRWHETYNSGIGADDWTERQEKSQ